MRKCLLIIWFSIIWLSGQAQLVVAPNTSISSGTNTLITTNSSVNNQSTNFNLNSGSGLVLAGTNQTLTTSSDLIIPRVGITGGGTKVLKGNFYVPEELLLNNGLLISGTRLNLGLFLLGPSVNISESGPNSYVVGSLAQQGGGTKYFPIGTSAQFAPVTLFDVTGTDNVATALITGQQDGSFLPTSVPAEIDSVSQNWFWRFASRGLASTKVQLPILAEDAGLVSGESRTGVVLQVDSVSKTASNLGGAVSENAIVSAASPMGIPSYLMVGSSLIINPLIHNLITINNDGQNDFLVIENINIYANNEVILLDRWGTEVYRKKGFINYDEFENPYDGSFDFLEPGNYICIVKYAGRSAKQMITVLK